jgi:(R)-2-hydroxyacyl-CoA dehydratese activating ATPase
MRSMGIDIGSRAIKSVILNDNRIERMDVYDATSRPFELAESILNENAGIPIMATGYGRHLLELRDVPSITEIRACAHGVWWRHTDVGTVIDIGGQDLKIIILDKKGKVVKFEMNDRCAAGTGKFLEIMAAKLDYSLTEFGAAALTGSDTITINSLCTVFAESEVIGLLNKNVSRQDIARGLHQSVIKKIAGMYKRIDNGGGNVVVVGGGALNPGIIELLGKKLFIEVSNLENPQHYAALGAALFAAQRESGPS